MRPSSSNCCIFWVVLNQFNRQFIFHLLIRMVCGWPRGIAPDITWKLKLFRMGSSTSVGSLFNFFTIFAIYTFLKMLTFKMRKNLFTKHLKNYKSSWLVEGNRSTLVLISRDVQTQLLGINYSNGVAEANLHFRTGQQSSGRVTEVNKF